LKRITFKKSFDGVANALRLIPESFKVEDKKFELTDGNEKYLVEWKDGRPMVLEASDRNMISEDYAKMKHLMGYKSEPTLGTPDAKSRVSENTRLFENATGAAFGTQGNGFTSEGDLMEDEKDKYNDGDDYDEEDARLHARKYGEEENTIKEWSPNGSIAFSGDKSPEKPMVSLDSLEVGDLVYAAMVSGDVLAVKDIRADGKVGIGPSSNSRIWYKDGNKKVELHRKRN
jgi:hypothetical protein